MDDAQPAFDVGFALEILPELLEGLEITVLATVIGYTVALVLGLGLAMARRAPLRAIALPVGWFVEFVRSTPLLVQLYFLFYVAPDIGLRMSPLVTGIAGLALHYGAYASEVFRAGIDGVPRGQREAAIALNLSPWQTFRDIILPQAIPPIVPALGNLLVAMFKDTPLLSAITVVEMLQQAKLIGADTFRYLEPLTMVGILFLIVSLLSAVAIRWVEKRVAVRHA